MTTGTTYDEAWTNYRDAVDALFRGGPASAERGGGDLVAAADLDARADDVVIRSTELGAAAEVGLSADDPGVRELAELQHVAAAALDLAVADRLAHGEEPAAGAERGETQLPRELLEILGTPQSAGVAGLTGQPPVSRGTAGSTDVAGTTEEVLDDIVGASAKAGSALTTGLLEIPGLPLQEAAAVVGHELLQRLGAKVSRLVRRAVALVVAAVEKLGKALGRTGREAVRKEATGWLDRLRKGEVVRSLLEALYQPDRITAEIRTLVEETRPSDPKRRQATARLEELDTGFARHAKVVEWIARGLALVRGWLLGLQPAGPIALVACHVLALGYIVYAGGDHADWYRTGEHRSLDRVPGVRAVVRQALTAPA